MNPEESNDSSVKDNGEGQTEIEKFQEKFQDTASTSSESESVGRIDGSKDEICNEIEENVGNVLKSWP